MILGIEGGGTRTRIISEANDRDAAQYRTYEVSVKFRDIGIHAAANRLARIIEQDYAGTNAMAIALSGAADSNDRATFAIELARRLALDTQRIFVDTDSAIALKACPGNGDQKILLIAGTGSVCIGSDQHGAMHSVGGWGPMVGDEGSGRAIGVLAVRHLTHVLDRREAPTKLSDALFAAIGLEGKELESYLKSPELPVAAFARVVFECESERSEQILDEAALDLARLVQAVLLRIAAHSTRPDTLFLSGSIAKAAAIASRLKRHLPLMAMEPLDEDAPARLLLAVAHESIHGAK